MEGLAGYGSAGSGDEQEEAPARSAPHRPRAPSHRPQEHRSASEHRPPPRRDDDTNYDDVTMDMSEDSNNNESDRELPQAEPDPNPPRHQEHGRNRKGSEGDRWVRSSRESPDKRRKSPHYPDKRHASPSYPDKRRQSPLYANKRRESPDKRRESPNKRRESPDKRRESPNKRRESPNKRRESPNKRCESPDSRDKRRQSPDCRDKRRQSPPRYRKEEKREKYDREISPKRDNKYRSERPRLYDGSASSTSSSSSRRGLLGDRPDERAAQDSSKVPALMDLKLFGGEPSLAGTTRNHDAKDTKEIRSGDRDKDRRERDRERERDKDRHGRRSQEKKSSNRRPERRSRSRSRERRPDREGRSDRDRDRDREVRSKSRGDVRHAPEATYIPHPASRGAGAGSPPQLVGEYRPSYKVSKKLQVMEKMGLQIKTPDGSMATAQQLMQRSVMEHSAPPGPPGPLGQLPSYYNPNAAAKVVTQVQKRKLLWGKKEEAAPVTPAVKWTATKFAQDTDGKVANKFMRLMGIKDPEAVKPPVEVDDKTDLNKKQEEMFQAMQAQYDVARATTHTMRGVGLGFQRQF